MIKAITGTKDILPGDISKWHYVESVVNSFMNRFNYKEIRTPVFEETSLFSRGIGEATDIVSKEMYTFTDRSNTSVTLKPEMTASVMRAYHEHSLDKKQTLSKLYYISPMFRQERPQAGRLRQFHQFGAEAVGSNDPALDAEMITLAYYIIKELGLKNLSVKINSLGIPASREKYKVKLREFLGPRIGVLSEESKKRYDTNVLRIFDSKAETDQAIMDDAPLLIDYLDEESKDNFNIVKNLLYKTGVKYEVDPRLVRGLDYYTHTTFEIISGSVGSQSALCGGGRYNLLSEQIGGKEAPGVGFAAGIERILLACENEQSLNLEEEKIDLYIAVLNKELKTLAYEKSFEFRTSGLSVELDYSGRSLKAQMREANKYNAKYVMFLGGDEYKNGEATLKDMENSEQSNFKLTDNQAVINKITGK